VDYVDRLGRTHDVATIDVGLLANDQSRVTVSGLARNVLIRAIQRVEAGGRLGSIERDEERSRVRA
jgi:hypothetical protein